MKRIAWPGMNNVTRETYRGVEIAVNPLYWQDGWHITTSLGSDFHVTGSKEDALTAARADIDECRGAE